MKKEVATALILLLGTLLLSAAAVGARAQVVLDGSLGTSGSIPLVAGEYAITDDLGRYAGADNLFHSFSFFDVGSGETAHFSASLGTPLRVIARVTGGTRSQINGVLRSSIPGADLYLLNDSGVSLGDGARLDVQGSFYTSTADALRFESGPDLLVGDAAPEPLLSAAAPSAFGFTSANPALIEVARTRALSVPAGETLSFVGGDVFVTGQPGFGIPDVIAAPGASLEIAAAAGPVDIPVTLDQFDPDAVDPAVLGRVEISAFAKVRMSGTGGAVGTPSGRVVIRGSEFALASDAQIVARNDSQTAALGPVDIAVAGDLVLDGTNSQIQSWTGGEGAAGDVLLSGDRVLLRNGAELILFNGGVSTHTGHAPSAQLSGRVISLDSGAGILLRSLSAGSASSLTLVGTEAIQLQGGASAISDLLANSSGPGGTLLLAAPDVIVSGNAQISTLDAGSGTGAAIDVRADSLTLKEGGGLVSLTTGSGAGGRIHLETGLLRVTDAGRIASDTSNGPGGAIEVVGDRVVVSNESDRPEGTFVQARNGGSITLDVARLELVHGGQIFTRTDGAADAGALLIRNADAVSAVGIDAAPDPHPSGLFTRSGENATGNGGLLSVNTNILEVNDGAQLSSATSGAGDAGAMDLVASERMTVQGGAHGFSLVSASTEPGSTGNGNTIAIRADRLELRDGGRITTSTTGAGDAGLIDARARVIAISGVDPATGANASGFFSRSNTPGASGGDGGDVILRAGEAIFMADGAQISTSSSGSGLAGDIDIDAGTQLRMDGSLITTKAQSSSGGNVHVSADGIVYLEDSAIETDVLGGAGGGGDVAIDPVHTVLQRSHITARAVTGAGGNISIATDYYFPSGESYLDASSQLGIDGTINVTSPDSDLVGGLGVLPTAYLDASSQLARDCAARTERAGSFVVHTREAARPAPDAAFEASEAEQCQSMEGTP